MAQPGPQPCAILVSADRHALVTPTVDKTGGRRSLDQENCPGDRLHARAEAAAAGVFLSHNTHHGFECCDRVAELTTLL